MECLLLFHMISQVARTLIISTSIVSTDFAVVPTSYNIKCTFLYTRTPLCTQKTGLVFGLLMRQGVFTFLTCQEDT